MEKDFDRWNKKKKQVDKESFVDFYHEREMWWCSLGMNIGFEQDGTGKNFDRPILITKGFSKNVFVCVPLTGKRKVGKYYFYLGRVENREATALLSQIRLVDTKRLHDRLAVLAKDKFEEIKKAIKSLI